MTINKFIVLLVIGIMPDLSTAQVDEATCLSAFNSMVYQGLMNAKTRNPDLPVIIHFELQLSEFGIIDSIKIVRSNLKDFEIRDVDVIAVLINRSLPCLREWGYIPKGGIMPERIMIPYKEVR